MRWDGVRGGIYGGGMSTGFTFVQKKIFYLMFPLWFCLEMLFP